MYFSVSLLHADVQFLVYVGLQGFMKLFRKVQPEGYVFVAGFAVVFGSTNPPTYAGQDNPAEKLKHQMGA